MITAIKESKRQDKHHNKQQQASTFIWLKNLEKLKNASDKNKAIPNEFCCTRIDLGCALFENN